MLQLFINFAVSNRAQKIDTAMKTMPDKIKKYEQVSILMQFIAPLQS